MKGNKHFSPVSLSVNLPHYAVPVSYTHLRFLICRLSFPNMSRYSFSCCGLETLILRLIRQSSLLRLSSGESKSYQFISKALQMLLITSNLALVLLVSIFENIGTMLRKQRELKGFSQEYVAGLVGVSTSVISKIETSKTKRCV